MDARVSFAGLILPPERSSANTKSFSGSSSMKGGLAINMDAPLEWSPFCLPISEFFCDAVSIVNMLTLTRTPSPPVNYILSITTIEKCNRWNGRVALHTMNYSRCIIETSCPYVWTTNKRKLEDICAALRPITAEMWEYRPSWSLPPLLVARRTLIVRKRQVVIISEDKRHRQRKQDGNESETRQKSLFLEAL